MTDPRDRTVTYRVTEINHGYPIEIEVDVTGDGAHLSGTYTMHHSGLDRYTFLSEDGRTIAKLIKDNPNSCRTQLGWPMRQQRNEINTGIWAHLHPDNRATLHLPRLLAFTPDTDLLLTEYIEESCVGTNPYAAEDVEDLLDAEGFQRQDGLFDLHGENVITNTEGRPVAIDCGFIIPPDIHEKKHEYV